MKTRSYKKNKLTSAITLALMPILFGTSYSALAAQESEETTKSKRREETAKSKKEKEREIELIEVTGYRGSITGALNAKKNANSVIDSINADDIGSFPDNNVAEALQRVPGVAITRSLNGDGESVSIRGFAPGKNMTLINGEQFSSSSFNYENALGRGANYGMLPATMVQRVEVHKSSEAYLPEGGVGGTVNVITRKPLDQKKELVFVASGSSSFNTISEYTAPRFSALTSWKINDNFGALVSLDYSKRKSRRDAVEVLAYNERSFTTDKGDVFTDVLVPGALGSANFTQMREHKTAMVTLQYQPSDAVAMNLSYLRSTMSGDSLNTNLISMNHNASFFKHEEPGTVLDATLDENTNTITRIDYAAPTALGARAGQIDVYFREAALKSQSVDFDIHWLGDSLALSAAVGTSKSSGGGGLEKGALISVLGKSTVGIDDGVGYVQYHDFDVADFSNAPALGHATLLGHASNKNTSGNEHTYITLDGEYYLDESFFTSIQIGARYSDATQEQRRWSLINDFHQKTEAHEDLRGPASNFGEFSFTPDDFLSGISGNAVTRYQYLHPNELQGHGIEYTPRANQGSSFDVSEGIASIYTQANFKRAFDFYDVTLRGNLGLRYSDQSIETRNFTRGLKVDNPKDLVKINNMEFDFVREGHASKLLPSVNLILDLENNLVVRSAYSTVISRPAFGQLAQQLTASPRGKNEPEWENTGTFRNANKGNADLKPFEADKYDLSTEWYYAEGSSISLGLFYYNIKTFVTNITTEEVLFDDGEIYKVTQPINKEGASIEGFEFAVAHQLTSLPAPFDGLGIRANYTYIDSVADEVNPLTDEPLPIAGLSKTTYNASLFYSKNAWNARISYNYREAYYEQLRANYPRFNDDSGHLTAQVKYTFANGLGVYVQGTNLTNQQNKRFIGDETRPFQTSEGGQNFAAGINYKF